MTNSFTNKVALVTGATSGIGRATAIAFAQAGAKVVIAGRREDEGAKAVKEIEEPAVRPCSFGPMSRRKPT